MPEFMDNPVKYFTNKEDLTGSSALLVHSKLPLVEDCELRLLNSKSSKEQQVDCILRISSPLVSVNVRLICPERRLPCSYRPFAPTSALN